MKITKNQVFVEKLMSSHSSIPQIFFHKSIFWWFRQWFGRPGFNPRSSHTKDSKIALDAALLNTQHYKVTIKGKGEQFFESLVWLDLGLNPDLSDHGRTLYSLGHVVFLFFVSFFFFWWGYFTKTFLSHFTVSISYQI